VDKSILVLYTGRLGSSLGLIFLVGLRDKVGADGFTSHSSVKGLLSEVASHAAPLFLYEGWHVKDPYRGRISVATIGLPILVCICRYLLDR
jgi:hypothetical protein